MDFDELWKRVSSYLVEKVDEPLYNRQQAADYLEVTPDTIDYYVRKRKNGERLQPDLIQKQDRTFAYLFCKSTLDEFKKTLGPSRGPKKVRKP